MKIFRPRRWRRKGTFRVGDYVLNPEGKLFVIHSKSSSAIMLRLVGTEQYYATNELVLRTYYSAAPDSGV